MILYVLKQNKNSKSAAFGKWFAFPVIEETIDLDALAEHMSNHNTPYSKGAIKGMLTDMVGCIKELLLEGKNVKIADLAIFSLGIKNNGGVASEEVFSVSKNIKGVKLRARATGELIAKNLNLEATLKKASATTKVAGNGGTTGGGNNGGSDNQGGTGSITGGNSGSGSNTGSGTNTGGNSGSGSNTGGSNTGGNNSGSQSGESGVAGDYRLVIYKYGNGTSTVTDDSEQEINSNDQVHSGSNVNISVVPAGGKEPLAKVNGIRIALTENDGTYTGSFVMPTKGTVLEINSEPSEWDYADEN